MYSVLSAISSSYPHLKGRLPTCSSPVRHSRREASSSLAVRLACLRRAASVRSEPGSNSPLFYFKHPEGRLTSIILSKSRFLFLGTLTFEKKEKHTQKAIPSCAFLFSLFFVLRLFSLPKIFALWLFLLSLPFIFKDHYAQSCSYLLQQARNIIYAFRFFCQASFSFFSFLFFHQL